MKKQNEVIEISNSEFVVSTDAKTIFESYLKSIKKKYRFDRKAYNELETALRDVLLDLPAKKSGTIDKKTATECVGMIGDEYDGQRVVSKLISRTGNIIFSRFIKLKSLVLTASFRRKMYYGFAFTALIPIGIMISTLPVFDSRFYDQPQPDSSTLETTLGTVTYGEWAKQYEPSGPLIIDNNTTRVTYSIIIVFLLAFIFLIAMAQKSKYTKHIFGLLLVSFVASYGMSLNAENSVQDAINYHTGYLRSFEPPEREMNDYDKLSACGTQINYIELGLTSGKMYYGLKDQGFTLAKELETQHLGQEPTRTQICGEYDTLRTMYPDDSIVLQTFIIDDNKAERPVDFKELDYNSQPLKIQKIRYGFYTKVQE